jgi:RNA polymerase sigma-70 factor (ECF subfamily)
MKTKAAYSEVSFPNQHKDLIEGCKKGDQRAQFQIYKLYYKAMYNTSLGIVNETMEAEDIMQESFLSAFEKIATYSGTVSFGAWLKKIVQNRSFDFLREKSKVAFEDIETCQGIEDKSSDDSDLYEERDRRIKKVIETIKYLSEGCRNIISLYFLKGYDHEEIGKILSISSSTSRSQLSRAKSKLITELKGKL